MRDTRTTAHDEAGSGFGLIVGGLLLALLGAGSIMLMVLGASFLYVGRYGHAAGLLAGFVAGGIVFFRTYGRYLARLEARVPMEPQVPSIDREQGPSPLEPASPQRPIPNPPTPSASPLPTNVVIALATGGYGVFILVGGLIWTHGQALLLNLIAGAALLLCGILSWLLGQARGNTEPGALTGLEQSCRCASDEGGSSTLRKRDNSQAL
jgi:hypothetical protein